MIRCSLFFKSLQESHCSKWWGVEGLATPDMKKYVTIDSGTDSELACCNDVVPTATYESGRAASGESIDRAT